MGTVTDAGKGVSGVDVKIGTETIKTDKDGKFSVTEKNVGKYSVEVAPKGYLAQSTSVEIAANAENRSVVTVAVALTKQSEPTTVEVGETGNTEEVKVEDKSASNEEVKEPGTVEPEDVKEDLPLVTPELEIPAGAIQTEGNEDVLEGGNAEVSVTTYVPAPETVTTEVKKEEENKEVEKTIPLAAAHFEPSGLTFAKDHYPTISIPNPIPGLTFADDMVLTYLENGKWVPQTEDINKVVYDEKSGSYTTKVKHFSSYAMENKVTSKVSTENVVKSEILGQASCDNSENPKAVTGIALTYKEKSGWECKDADIKAAVEKALSGAKPETVNAMVAFFKTRLYSLMGSASGITETTRTYNTVNVNGYTTMTYTCYAKTRTTTLSTTVKYNNKDVKISVTATRYTGTDHQYKTVTTNPTHSGGKGGSN
jgi:carboxypeptidase regulatory region